MLTHWGRVTHICVSKLNIIGWDNGLSPWRRQAIIWTSVGILLIGPLGTNFSQILIEIYTCSVKKMHLKISSGIWRPFCLGFNVLMHTHTALFYWKPHSQCYNNKMTSWWVRWYLKSPASRLFTQPFVQMKENTNALRHWPLWGEFTDDG